eukprot:TRINITY_DN2630_c0_g1_i2.p1 TRINITY_DN2630_c0_g1~~TRINITY_DN2630_c0_g1_i2.p1  ORF type:complete len:678 (-),score=110.20 TRINITY_DN2630_c0_g1_i2:143-2176(-)
MEFDLARVDFGTCESNQAPPPAQYLHLRNLTTVSAFHVLRTSLLPTNPLVFTAELPPSLLENPEQAITVHPGAELELALRFLSGGATIGYHSKMLEVSCMPATGWVRVTGLPEDAEPIELSRFFEEHIGPVRAVREDGRGLQVEFVSLDSATAAITRTGQLTFQGSTLYTSQVRRDIFKCTLKLEALLIPDLAAKALLNPHAPPFFPESLTQLFDTPASQFLFQHPGVKVPQSFRRMFAESQHHTRAVGGIQWDNAVHMKQFYAFHQCLDDPIARAHRRLVESLNLESSQMSQDMKRFDQYHCRIQMLDSQTRQAELEVPGLSEKRPELVYGDFVQIRLADERFQHAVEYVAVIVSTGRNKVVLELPQESAAELTIPITSHIHVPDEWGTQMSATGPGLQAIPCWRMRSLLAQLEGRAAVHCRFVSHTLLQTHEWQKLAVSHVLKVFGDDLHGRMYDCDGCTAGSANRLGLTPNGLVMLWADGRTPTIPRQKMQMKKPKREYYRLGRGGAVCCICGECFGAIKTLVEHIEATSHWPRELAGESLDQQKLRDRCRLDCGPDMIFVWGYGVLTLAEARGLDDSCEAHEISQLEAHDALVAQSLLESSQVSTSQETTLLAEDPNPNAQDSDQQHDGHPGTHTSQLNFEQRQAVGLGQGYIYRSARFEASCWIFRSHAISP